MNKTLGSTLIVAGVAIGGGLLALPIVTASLGWPLAFSVMGILWLVIIGQALLLLKIILQFPLGVNYYTIAQETLGKTGKWISIICVLFLYNALLVAYLSSVGSFAKTVFPGWEKGIMMGFSLVFFSIIVLGKNYVDGANRLFFFLKTALFVALLVVFFPHTHTQYFFDLPTFSFLSLRQAIPILVAALSFFSCVPSLVEYIGKEEGALRKALIRGSVIVVFCYLIWQLIVLGVLPLRGPISFEGVLCDSNALGLFVTNLNRIVHPTELGTLFQIFSTCTVITCFLGVGMALLDFMEDMTKSLKSQRKVSIILSVLPSLIFALWISNLFIQALSFAMIPASLLSMVMPPLMAWRLKIHSPLVWIYFAAGLLIFFICVWDRVA